MRPWLGATLFVLMVSWWVALMLLLGGCARAPQRDLMAEWDTQDTNYCHAQTAVPAEFEACKRNRIAYRQTYIGAASAAAQEQAATAATAQQQQIQMMRTQCALSGRC